MRPRYDAAIVVLGFPIGGILMGLFGPLPVVLLAILIFLLVHWMRLKRSAPLKDQREQTAA